MQNFPNELLNDIRSHLEEEKRLLEARIDELLESLRNDLREELRLAKLDGKLWWIRVGRKEDS